MRLYSLLALRRTALGALCAAAVSAILLASGAAALDIGPETPVVNLISPEPDKQQTPAVAAWSGGYLLVYQNRRNGTDYDISGVLVDTNGNPKGPSFIISTVTGGTSALRDQRNPAVAFNGTNFLVVWGDYRSPDPNYSKIYGARVTTSGTVLDQNGFQIYGFTGGDQTSPEVASNGTDWYVVWERNPNTGGAQDIYGCKVTAAGVVSTGTSASSFNNTPPTGWPPGLTYYPPIDSSPSIAWNGTYYLVAYQCTSDATDYDVYASVLYPTGSVYRGGLLMSATGDISAPQAVTGPQISPRVVSGWGGMFFIVWQDTRNTANGSDIYGVRTYNNGSLADSESLPIADLPNNQQSPGLAYDGTNFVVSWKDTFLEGTTNVIRERAARVTTDGMLLDSAYLVLSSGSPDASSGCSIGAYNGQSLVTWVVGSGITNADVLGCTVDQYGNAGTEAVLSVFYQDQPGYSVSFDGTNYVVAWTDRRTSKSAIYVARVTPYGEVLDPVGVRVYASTSDQKEPAILWDGSNYFVAWAESGVLGWTIRGMRLTASLAPVDAAPLEIGITGLLQDEVVSGQHAPALGWNGSSYLVVWTDDAQKEGVPFNTDIMGARYVPSSGAIYRMSSRICSELHDQSSPAVSSDGSNWMIVWQDTRDSTTVNGVSVTVNQVYYNRVAADGTIAGTANGAKVSTVVSRKTVPKIAFDGTRYFVVWADNRASAVTYGVMSGIMDIYGVRLSTTGTRQDASDIAICSLGTTDRTNPVVAWAGDRFYVAWQDSRSYTAAASYDIYAARVTAAGAVSDAGGLFISSGGYSETAPCIISGATNWTGVFYSRNITPIHELQFRAVGEQTAVALTSLSDARSLPNGRKVSAAGKVVTAGTTQLGTCFYIEEADRSAGLRVADATVADEAGVVDVTGILATVNGERQIINAAVTVGPSPGTVPGPLGLVLNALGGAAYNASIPGVYAGLGLNNIGLLVKVCGTVVGTGTNYFTVQDGSAGTDGVILQVKMVCPAGVTVPSLNQKVSVTGISSCEPGDSGYVRRVLVRKPGDIVPF